MINAEARQQFPFSRAAATDTRHIRLSVRFFVISVVSFVCGTVAAPWAIERIFDFFYQPPLMAWVHTFTLGWMTAMLTGAIYSYVPAASGRSLIYPRLATAQFYFFLIGVSGMIAHFLMASWDGIWMAGAVVVASVVLLAINVFPYLRVHFGKRPAETGLLAAITLLIAAGTAGVLLALDKTADFLPGTLLDNVGAHVHLAALGWISILVCIFSWAPGVLGDAGEVPHYAIGQILALAAAAAALAAAIALRAVPLLLLPLSAIVVVLLCAAMFRAPVRPARETVNWSGAHTRAASLGLLMAGAAGIALAITGSGTALGNRVAGCYGILGLLGWAGNFLIGFSYQLFADVVEYSRTARGWNMPDSLQLPSPLRPAIFWSFNIGVVLIAAGLLLNKLPVAMIGTVLFAAAGLLYGFGSSRVLIYAYRPAGFRSSV